MLKKGNELLVTATALLIASSLSVDIARGQINTTPAFEAASLRQVPDDQAVLLSALPIRNGDRFTWNAPLISMMCYAYHLPRWRISGINDGVSFYTVIATLDPSANDDQVRLMLQALLVERFKIVARKETRELQGYALVVAKNGPKFKTANSPGEAPPMPDFMRGAPPAKFEGRIITSRPSPGVAAILGRGVPISQLADELSEDLHIVVVDRTGLTGKYYFGLKFQLEDRPGEESLAPSVFSALPDELGLRLDKQKLPGEFLTVDHFEKPSAN